MVALVNICYTVVDVNFEQLSRPLDVEVSSTIDCLESISRAKH